MYQVNYILRGLIEKSFLFKFLIIIARKKRGVKLDCASFPSQCDDDIQFYLGLHLFLFLFRNSFEITKGIFNNAKRCSEFHDSPPK